MTAKASNGFYLQDPVGDGNPATSDGIFVFTGSGSPILSTIAVGKSYQVSGKVTEFGTGLNLTITQITSPTVTPIASLGTVTPTVIGALGGPGVRVPPTQVIDDDNFTAFEPATDGIDFFESLEGMVVTIRNFVAVAPTFGSGNNANIWGLSDQGKGSTGLSLRGTSNIAPGDFNPEKIQIRQNDTILPGFAFPNVNVGDRLGDITGVVTYSGGNYEIIPIQPFRVVNPTALTPEVTTFPRLANRSNQQLLIASYNVLNLDPNDNDGDTDIADGRFATIARHIVNNLAAPDIIGLQEIQDNSGRVDDGTTSATVTLQTLVDAIDLADDGRLNGSLVYRFIDNPFIINNQVGGEPSGNIRTAFLYNPARVAVVPNSVGTLDPNGNFTQSPVNFFNSRPPLVARFVFLPNGQELTIVNNHFTSKGGSAPLFGTVQNFAALQEDTNVNAGLANRRLQAQAVANYLNFVRSRNPDANLVVLGDLNEFEFVSPLQIVAGTLQSSPDGLSVTPTRQPAFMRNLIDTLPENERYSFIFQGNSQSLDHILVSTNLEINAKIDIVHVNSEFATTPSTASDHEPLVALINFTIRGTTGNDVLTSGDTDDVMDGDTGSDTLDGRGGDDVLIGSSGNDRLLGGLGNDLLSGGSGSDELLGGPGNDVLDGGSGFDELTGGQGNDVLDGGSGFDTVIEGYTGSSDGQYLITDQAIIHRNAAGTALVPDGLGEDTLISIERVVLTGGNGNEVFDASGFSGVLGVELNGGAGNDVLVGGFGTDVLTGGAGSDRFGFTASAAFSASAHNPDVITDFDPNQDFLVLSRTMFDGFVEGTASGTLLSGGTPVSSGDFAVINVPLSQEQAVAGNATALIVYNQQTGHLFYNQNRGVAGFGTGGLLATLVGTPNLTASRVLLVP